MEKYCLNINTDSLENKYYFINNYNYNYNFLREINFNGETTYYKILNNIEEFKLKNFYNYIYNKINNLNINDKLYKINIDEIITYDKLNNLLYNYIKCDILKGIIIMNSIQLYYHPEKYSTNLF